VKKGAPGGLVLNKEKEFVKFNKDVIIANKMIDR
jgi:hypothetical protein